MSESPSLFVLEDNAEYLRLLLRALKQPPSTTDIAATVPQALATIENNVSSYRACLLDMAVPLTNEKNAPPNSAAGPQVYQFLTSLSVDASHIFLMTNDISTRDLEACHQRGIDTRLLIQKAQILNNLDKILSLLRS
jgi:ActR/RegA family two-component response regulator